MTVISVQNVKRKATQAGGECAQKKTEVWFMTDKNIKVINYKYYLFLLEEPCELFDRPGIL